jgi:O-antigen ligase
VTSWLWMAAAAPFVLALAVLFLREPLRLTLPVFAAAIPFGQALSVGPGVFGSVSSLVGLLLAVGLALQLLVSGRLTDRISPSVPAWLLFLGMAAAASVWTIDREASLRGLVALGSLVGIFVLVALSRVDRMIIRRAENGLLAGGAAVVGYGLYQLIFLGGFPDDTPGAGTVADGRFGNDLLGPGTQALSLLLPLLLAMSRAFREPRLASRLTHAVIAVAMLWGILMTGSRTGTLAVAAAMAFLVWSGPRDVRKGMALSMVAGLVLAALVWIYQPAGVATRSFETATSSSGRYEIWRVGLAACDQYCGPGAGWGAYPRVYAETQPSVPGARVLVGSEGSYEAHNLWLLALIELGVVGLLLLAWGLGLSFVEALRLPATLRGPPLGAMAGLLVAVNFLSSMEYKFFWMTLIMVALYRNLAPTTSVPRVPHHRAVV